MAKSKKSKKSSRKTVKRSKSKKRAAPKKKARAAPKFVPLKQQVESYMPVHRLIKKEERTVADSIFEFLDHMFSPTQFFKSLKHALKIGFKMHK